MMAANVVVSAATRSENCCGAGAYPRDTGREVSGFKPGFNQ
jgi:hypothetical protein